MYLVLYSTFYQRIDFPDKRHVLPLNNVFMWTLNNFAHDRKCYSSFRLNLFPRPTFLLGSQRALLEHGRLCK